MIKSKIKSTSRSRSNQQATDLPTGKASHKPHTIPTLCALLFALCLLTFTSTTTATIRYVSHTGSSTPPYTSWETAADSIQKCIDYSVDGDTIIVANGVYYESLIVNKYLWLIGCSMDSTVIDGTNVANITVRFEPVTITQPIDAYFENFMVKGNVVCISISMANVYIKNCRIQDAYSGISIASSSSVVDQCIIINVERGVNSSCDTCNRVIKYSSIVIQTGQPATRAILFDGGNGIVYNNIIIDGLNSISRTGIESGLFWDASNVIAYNNIVSGFAINIEGFAEDTAIVHNNTSSHAIRGIDITTKTNLRNNIVINNETGVLGPTSTNSDYNLYWQNNSHTSGQLGQNDIISDPMFVRDTIPAYGGTYDYHLQMFSPAIDAGDPNILDVDGTRSDIGAYGGPGGQSYVYIDLPPRPPVNLSAVVDSNSITIKWNRNTEADTSHYNVYRDTVVNFTIDPSKLVSSQTDTIFIQPLPQNIETLYYKITAVDKQENESLPSEELRIVITTMNDYPLTINDYLLYQNFPNPFNPTTKIGYKLKERGYVKLMVYDIKGELISVLVNEVKEAGYYEVIFDTGYSMLDTGHKSNGLASGIYLYRIEVIGEGNIPRFSDMKKMILLR